MVPQNQTTLRYPSASLSALSESLDKVIKEYQNKNNQKFLNTMKESTLEIVSRVLSECKNLSPIPGNEDIDTLVQGDIHGDLETLIKKLYLTRFIDDSGKFNPEKQFISLGDVFSNGPFPNQSYLFLAAIQNQCPSKVIRVAGNHERKTLIGERKGGYLSWIFKQIPRVLSGKVRFKDFWQDLRCFKKQRDMVKKDILHGRMVGAYSKGSNVFVHAGLPNDPEFQKQLAKEVTKGLDPADKDFPKKLAEATAKHISNELKNCVNKIKPGKAGKAVFKENPLYQKKNLSPDWSRSVSNSINNIFKKVLFVVGHNPVKSGIPEVKDNILSNDTHKNEDPYLITFIDKNNNVSIIERTPEGEFLKSQVLWKYGSFVKEAGEPLKSESDSLIKESVEPIDSLNKNVKQVNILKNKIKLLKSFQQNKLKPQGQTKLNNLDLDTEISKLQGKLENVKSKNENNPPL